MFLELKNKWIHIEKGKKRKPPTFSVFMYFGALDRLRNPLLKYVLSIPWRKRRHGYCRACFSKPSSTSHADDLLLHLKNWDQLLTSEITLASQPDGHNSLLDIVNKFVCWQLIEGTPSQNPKPTGWGHEPSSPWQGKATLEPIKDRGHRGVGACEDYRSQQILSSE